MNRFTPSPTAVSGVTLLTPLRHEDERGWFLRHFCLSELGLTGAVRQANLVATNRENTFRGFHFQVFPSAESKVFSCLSGRVTFFAVDLRSQSKTFMEMAALELQEVGQQLLVTPPGVAVGYLSRSDSVLVHYYSTADYDPLNENGIRWNDQLLKKRIPFDNPVLSKKDRSWPDLSLAEISRFRFD